MNESNPPAKNNNPTTGQPNAAFGRPAPQDLVDHLRSALAKAGVSQDILADPRIGLSLTNIIRFGLFQEKLGPIVRVKFLEATLREVLMEAAPHLKPATLARAQATLVATEAPVESRGNTVQEDLDEIRGDR